MAVSINGAIYDKWAYLSSRIYREKRERESCYSPFIFINFPEALNTERKIFRANIFPFSQHSRNTSISFSPISSLRHSGTQKQKARSKKLAAFTSPSFATIFLPLSPLSPPSRSSPSTSSRGTFPQQRFFAFDICDLNFRYREFPERKCRLIVPSVTLLGPNPLSLSPARVSRFPSHFSPSHILYRF